MFGAALIKYGIGSWTVIIKTRCLPGKTVAQLYNQAQRLLGQQSLAEFQGLSLDIPAIFARNANIVGTRKNNCLINTGNKLMGDQLKALKIKNQKDFGISQDDIDALVIPELEASDMSNVLISQDGTAPTETRLQKIQKIRRLQGYLRTFEQQREDHKRKLIEDGEQPPATKKSKP